MKPDEYLSLVQELAKTVDKNELTKLEFKHGDLFIKVQKNPNKYFGSPSPLELDSRSHSNTVNTLSATESTHKHVNLDGKKTDDNSNVVRSPMVGVIYTSSSPEKPNFVEKDQLVKEGDTLFLIEAMKIFTPIKANFNYKIKDILVQNQQVVEFNEILLNFE